MSESKVSQYNHENDRGLHEETESIVIRIHEGFACHDVEQQCHNNNLMHVLTMLIRISFSF